MSEKNLMLIQKFMGVVMLLLTALIVAIGDGDITGVFITAPFGIWMLFSKEIIIQREAFEGDTEEEEEFR